MRVGTTVLGMGLALMLVSGTALAADIHVFAAASLKDGLDAVATDWNKAHSDAQLIPVYAATPALAKQIEEGAPADIFFSADEAWMDKVAEKKLIKTETRVDVLGNDLVLVGGKDAQGSDIATLLGGLGDGKLAVANTESVPAGKYAKAALGKMKLWDDVQSKLVQGENVRAALTFVEKGEAPLGIVYTTDTHGRDAVKVLAQFPADSHPPIIYPAAVVAASTNADAGVLLDYIKSPDAQKIFVSFGFKPPPK